ncbi:MAG: dihydrofolate reductase family protein [Acidobacteriota bacterium]
MNLETSARPRHVTFGAAVSLDGFLAGPGDEVDWLRWTAEVAGISAAYWTTIDTVVMGRRTWEAAARAGIRAYPGVRNIVCSTTLATPPGPAVELAADGVAAVRALRDAPGKGICVMGGGRFGRALLDAGLVDEVGLNVHPVVLGDGLPLFPPGRRVALERLECRPLGEGCVLLRYAVAEGRE